MVVEELERTRKSLWRTEDGSAATAQTVSKQINRLEYEVQQAKDDLRQSRQSLLMEQERSNSMIRSISTELDRTRRELDFVTRSYLKLHPKLSSLFICYLINGKYIRQS